ncbi:ribonuclease HII [Myroides guanonis]|uniref:Ribonuclease HII n=1 Tax=Myroides guanonis TaxID=1150112 RepID=A0A1I3ME36_9FLAO|nr:ribonuclease HII [Myroides guanonis]SFI94956.1 RNase HII [Myroides guanonis]
MLKKNYSTYLLEAGTDEAGRGCIAGPVTAAAVILPPDFENLILNDSKKLSEKTRFQLREIIYKEAISYKIIHLDHLVVDEINILNASIKAMQNALLLLQPQPEFIIVDGNRFHAIPNIPHQCIVKGDMKFLSIAAASVLAKTARDDYMNEIHEEFPMYNWKKNKGYPTKEHRMAIEKYGPSKYHRMTFKLLPDQIKIDF